MLDHIQAVIFDLYGTLIHIHTDEADIPGLWTPLRYFYAYYGARYTPETLMADYRAPVEREEQAARQRSGVAAAEINLERVFAALFTRRGVEVSPEVVRCVGHMFRANSTRTAELYPGARALLEDLRPLGQERLGILKICVLLVVVAAFLADGSAGFHFQRIPWRVRIGFLAKEKDVAFPGGDPFKVPGAARR